MTDLYYGVICPNDGPVQLTREEYMRQMNAPDVGWTCPHCGRNAVWDDERYEASFPEQPEDSEDD